MCLLFLLDTVCVVAPKLYHHSNVRVTKNVTNDNHNIIGGDANKKNKPKNNNNSSDPADNCYSDDDENDSRSWRAIFNYF